MKKFCSLGCLALVALAANSALAGRLIAVDSGRVLFEIDIATGAKTQIGNVSANAGTTGGLAINPATETVYLTSTSLDSLFTLDVDSGAATLVGAYGDSTVVMHGLEWDSSAGTLWGGSNGNLFRINAASGAATQVGVSGLSSFTNLVYHPGLNQLFATNSGTDSFYRVNRATGAMELIADLGDPTNPNGITYNFDNGLIYMVDNNTDMLYTIDPENGLATAIGSTGAGNLLGLVYIPEPASLMSLLVGGVMLASRRRG